MNIHINIVTEISIGTINGVIITQGEYDTAVTLWNNIQTNHIIGS